MKRWTALIKGLGLYGYPHLSNLTECGKGSASPILWDSNFPPTINFEKFSHALFVTTPT